MTRPYASNVEFRFFSGQSCNDDCSGLLQEMSMVGLMSHIAIIDRIALNRRSMSMRITFTRDHSISVPDDREQIPDQFELMLRYMNPIISGHVHNLHCSPEINSICIDGFEKSVYLVLSDILSGSITIKFSSLSLFAHIPENVGTSVDRNCQ